MTTSSVADYSALAQQALAEIGEAGDVGSLDALRPGLFGKKAPLTEAKKSLGQLDPDARKDAGQALNTARQEAEAAFDARRSELAAADRVVALESERMDLTEFLGQSEPGHEHPVMLARRDLEDIFIGMGYTVAEGPEVESAWYNFEALNIPEWHPARGSFDTIFVNLGEPEEVMLRSHTSPVQIRTMENQEPPIYIVAPGRVYRTDTADATHLPAFNQIEGLVIDKGITLGDLAGTIDQFVKALLGPDVETRLRPSYFPFTEPSAEFDIRGADGSWLELGGSGMVHPNTLRACGIDPEVWQGFAFGFGIDRLAVMSYQTDDLREFVNNDIRFLKQF